MASPPAGLIQSVDASVLIEMHRVYVPAVFPALWNRMGVLADEGRLVVADEVRRELLDRPILEWLYQHSGVGRAFDAQQNQSQLDLLARCPGLVDPTKTLPAADPFVVGLAMAIKR